MNKRLNRDHDFQSKALEPADSNLPQWIRSASERTDIINARLVGQAKAIIEALTEAPSDSARFRWAYEAAKIWLETSERADKPTNERD